MEFCNPFSLHHHIAKLMYFLAYMSDKLSDLIETSCIIQNYSIVFTLGSNRFVKSKKREREKVREK